MNIAWLVHGFNVRDSGRSTIDRLGPYLRAAGWHVGQVDYGWRLLAGVAVGNPSEAADLAAMSRPGDIAIGHSNGCAIIHRATYLGARFDRVFYINAALNTESRPGPCVTEFHALYAPDDLAVLTARYLPCSLWGSMGRDGFTGHDERARNHNLHSLLGVTKLGHSGAFALMPKFGPAITRLTGKPKTNEEVSWRPHGTNTKVCI